MRKVESRIGRVTKKAPDAAAAALAAMLSSGAPQDAVHARSLPNLEPTSSVSAELTEVKAARAKSPERKLTHDYLSDFKAWVEKNKKDAGSVDTFVDFYKKVVLKSLHRKDDDWFRKSIIEQYATEYKHSPDFRSGKRVYWDRFEAGDYKKLEALYGDDEEFLERMAADVWEFGVIFAHALQHPGDESLKDTILNPDRLQNSPHRDVLIKRLNEDLGRMLDTKIPAYLENVLKVIYPAMSAVQQEEFKTHLKGLYLKSKNEVMVEISDKVIALVSGDLSPEEFKLKTIQDRWRNVWDHWETTKDGMSFVEFKKFFENFGKKESASGEIKHNPKYDFYRKVYREGMKVFIRAAIMSEGQATRIPSYPLEYFHSDFKKISPTGFLNLNSFRDLKDLNESLLSYTELERLILEETLKSLRVHKDELSDQEKVAYVRSLNELPDEVFFASDPNQDSKELLLSFKEPESAFFVMSFWTSTLDHKWLEQYVKNVVFGKLKTDPVGALHLTQIALSKKESYLDDELVTIKKTIAAINLDGIQNLSQSDKDLLNLIRQNPTILDVFFSVATKEGSGMSGDFLGADTFQKRNIANLVDFLQKGNKYTLPGIFEKNGGLAEFKVSGYMLDKKYPIRKIIELSPIVRKLLREDREEFAHNESRAATLWWDVLGRKYDQSRTVLPTSVLSNEALFLRWDSITSNYKDLRMFDLKDPNAYLNIFQFVSQSLGSGVWTNMSETIDYVEFDRYAKEKISNGLIVELVDEVTAFGNIVDPVFAQRILLRILTEHGKQAGEHFRAWGFDTFDFDAVSDYRISSIQSLRRLETVLKLDRASAVKYLNVNNKFNITLDEGLIDNVTNLEEAIDIFSRLATVNQILSYTGHSREGIRFNSPALIQKITRLATVGDASLEHMKIGNVEKIRDTLNRGSRNSGNEFLNMLAGKFLEGNPNAQSLRSLIVNWSDFAKSEHVGRDARETYRQVVNFAFTQLQDVLEKNPGLKTDEFTKPLQERGFVFLDDPGNVAKAVGRLASGQITLGQVAQKAGGKIFGSTEDVVYNLSRAPFEAGMKDGASAEYVCASGTCTKETADAMLLTVRPDKVGMRMVVNRNGVVNAGEIKRELGAKYIASAPIAFSGGARLILDLAYDQGEQVGSHVKIDGRDGFVVSNRNGQTTLLNKRNMDIGEFSKLGIEISPDDLAKVESQPFNPVKRWSHRVLLDKIMKDNRLSAVTNMLLVSGGMQIGTPLLDGADSRRLFLKMKDGSTAIITSTKDMSTDRLVKLAIAAGASEAVYMDTGMYDSYEVVTRDGKSHSLGHKDTADSTQRAFLYFRD